MSATACAQCKRKKGHKCLICNGVRVFDDLTQLESHVSSKHANGNEAASSGEAHFGFLDATTRSTRGSITVAADGGNCCVQMHGENSVFAFCADVAGVIVTTTQTVSSASSAAKRKATADRAPGSPTTADNTAATSMTKRRAVTTAATLPPPNTKDLLPPGSPNAGGDAHAQADHLAHVEAELAARDVKVAGKVANAVKSSTRTVATLAGTVPVGFTEDNKCRICRAHVNRRDNLVRHYSDFHRPLFTVLQTAVKAQQSPDVARATFTNAIDDALKKQRSLNGMKNFVVTKVERAPWTAAQQAELAALTRELAAVLMFNNTNTPMQRADSLEFGGFMLAHGVSTMSGAVLTRRLFEAIDYMCAQIRSDPQIQVACFTTDCWQKFGVPWVAVTTHYLTDTYNLIERLVGLVDLADWSTCSSRRCSRRPPA